MMMMLILNPYLNNFFENPDLIPEPKEQKNVFLSRETGKKTTINSEMIILVKL